MIRHLRGNWEEDFRADVAGKKTATDKKLIEAYDSMCPGNTFYSENYGVEDQAELLESLRNMATLKPKDAALSIEWWGTFGSGPKWNTSALSFVHEFRRRLKLKKK